MDLADEARELLSSPFMTARLPLALLLSVVAGSSSTACGVSSDDGDVVTSESAEISPGCSPALPTRIRGTVEGEDGRSVNALLGIDLSDAYGNKVAPNGVQTHSANYSSTVSFNAKLAATGTTAPNQERVWSLCVSSVVKKAYYELYPKNALGHTDESRYGETVYQYVDTSTVGDYNVVLRLPVTHVNGGNTGAVNGYVTCEGQPVKASTLRAWSNEPGSACGIRSFSAGGVSGTDGYYLIDNLAGGQCWAPSQPTRIYVYGECNGAIRGVEKLVDIANGARPRVDIDLPTH